MNLTKTYSNVVDETIYSGIHKSGLRVYIMPKEGYSKSYALFGTHYGSIDSAFIIPGDNQPTVVPDGIAHFLEHKMFEQPDGSNVFESYAKHGASANAFTSFNMTAYLFESTQDVIENLEILLDFVQQPYFTDENVAKEQGIIGQEIRMYDDDPNWRLMMNFLSAMYKELPVRKDISGSIESISKIDKDILYKCYNTFYNLSNMVLFVIGDVNPDDIVACVDRKAKETKPFDKEIVRIYGNETAEVTQSEISQKLSVSVPMFMFGFKDTDIGFDGLNLLKKSVELSIVSEIVFGKSGPIYSKLYNEGHIMGALDVEVECEKDYGFIALSGESKDPKIVKQVVLEELDKIKSEGIALDDFNRVKRAFWGRYIKQFNNVNGVAHSFLSHIFNNINIFDFVNVIDNVSLDDVNKRLQRDLQADKTVLSVIEPM